MVEMFKKKEQCTGCSACYNACRFDAIEMIFDEEGFAYPHIENEKCTKCMMCSKACPIYKKNSTANLDMPKYISAIAKDNEILQTSSSGGVFSLLANRAIRSGGCVYGCALDQEIKPVHIRVDCYNDVHKLRGSKYVQSDISLIYLDVKMQLDKGRQVVFSGTPCQIAGLTYFLGKVYDNLFLAEVLCHGVPSSLLFEKHIRRLKKKYKGKIQNYEMRSKKKFGWGSENRTYFEVVKNNKTKKVHPLFTEYFTAFFYGISLRPSCYECKYSKPKRYGDITMGDFWGYYRTFKKHFPQGISVVSINNDKGQKVIDKLSDEMDISNVTFNDATDTNIHFKIPMTKMKQRETFYRNINKYGYNRIYFEVYFLFMRKKKILQTFYGRFVPGWIRRLRTDIKNMIKD